MFASDVYAQRELHHGHESAWNLIRAFAPYRRTAELTFALEIFTFLTSTGLMVYVRFARALKGGTIIALMVLGINVVVIFFVMGAMQRAKLTHGQGKKIKRREAEDRREERRQRQLQRQRMQGAAGAGDERPRRRSLVDARLATSARIGSLRNLLRGASPQQVQPTASGRFDRGVAASSIELRDGAERSGSPPVFHSDDDQRDHGSPGTSAPSLPPICSDRQLSDRLPSDQCQLLPGEQGTGAGRSDAPA